MRCKCKSVMRPVTRPILFLALLPLLLMLLLLQSTRPVSSSTVDLRPNPKRPTNPDVWMKTRRPETSYEGPLHQFESTMRIQDSVLKLKMKAGYTQCFYYVLLEGFQLHLYVTTISSNEASDVFDVFLSNGDGEHILDYVYQTTVSHHLNVTENDTYEVCLYNPVGDKTVSYSSYYYLTPLFTKTLEELAMLNNISIASESSVANLEVSVGRALSDVRNQPHSFRDFVVLQETNAYVQWKALLYIGLMLASFISTTVFIRRLFSSPSTSV